MAVNLVFGSLTIPPAASLRGSSAAARQLAVAGSRSAVPLIYGEDRIGALVLNLLSAGPGSTMLLVQCLWGFAGDSVNDLRLNDADLPAGSTQVHYDGTQTAPNAALVAAFAAQGIYYASSLTGYMYSVVAIPIREFDGGMNFTARVRGRKLYDPRKDSTAGGSGAHRLATPATWTWSDSPPLALADFCASPLYGLGRSVAWASVGQAANFTDAMIGTPAEKRRTLGISFITPSSAADVAETLRAHAGCFLLPTEAGISLLPDADAAPVASYVHANGDIAELSDLALRDTGNAPTAVEVVYTDTTAVPWRDASATAQVSGAGTTLPWRLSQVRMAGVQRYSQAMREAVERLNKLTLNDLSCTLQVFDVGIRHQVGDIVTVTHPLGLSAKAMRLTAPELVGPGRWRLRLQEHDPAAYSTAVATAATTPDTSFINPAGPPAAVVGFSSAIEEIGVRLRWVANAEVDVSSYELRQAGTDWATAAYLGGNSPTIAGGADYLWARPAAGTYTLRIKALDNEGLQSVSEASLSVTVKAPAAPSLSYAIDGPSEALSWSRPDSDFAIDRYEIRRGSAWSGADVVDAAKSSSYRRRADYAGARTYWVAAIDVAGNVGAASSIDVLIAAPGIVTSTRAEVIDNNVLLYWSAPATGSLPVERYEVRKGATWAVGMVVGSNGNSTFTTVFEQVGGAYSYWIAAVDSAGNVGLAVAIAATVSQPPDYVLRNNYDDDFAGITLGGLYLEEGRLYGPALGETIQAHFESRSWATPNAQILAGAPLVFQPSGASGYLERTMDYGTALPSTAITVTLGSTVLSGAVATLVQISYKSLAGDAWIDATPGDTKVQATGIRYVKVRATFTAAGGDDLIEVASLNIKLSGKLKTASGTGAAVSTDAGGTAVSFTETFIDVNSIVVTPSGTAARYALYDFLDVPNPATFKVLLFDASGARVSGGFSWTARGF